MKKLMALIFLLALGASGAAQPALDREAPEKLESATFGMGCYWTYESRWGSFPGVVRTRVGFSDGAEVVQMDFDPRVISYANLLDVFLADHDPFTSGGSRMYQNAVFFHTSSQKAEAEKRFAKLRAKGRVASTIEPVNFTPAKPTEQKYLLRHAPALWAEFKALYPNENDILSSPAATKVNGYLGGNSQRAEFDAYSAKLGLSESALKRLSDKVPEKAKKFEPHCVLPTD